MTSGAKPSKQPAIDYVEVVEGEDEASQLARARYTRVTLKSALRLMGCKTRVAHKVKICCQDAENLPKNAAAVK